MQTYQQSIGAGEVWPIHISGAQFFRLLSTEAPVTCRFFLNGSPVAHVENVEAGFAQQFAGQGFDLVRIESTPAQTVKIAAGAGVMSYDRLAGTVETVNRGAVTQSTETVTNVAADLVAANAARRFLMIQNNHTSGTVFLSLDGTAATVADLAIPAGGSLLFDVFVPTGAISAIGNILSNPSVVVVEG